MLVSSDNCSYYKVELPFKTKFPIFRVKSKLINCNVIKMKESVSTINNKKRIKHDEEMRKYSFTIDLIT